MPDLSHRAPCRMLSPAIALLAATAACTPSPRPIPVVEATIASVHNAIFSGRTTCRRVVQAHLDRIDAYEHLVNAITVVNPSALDRARDWGLEVTSPESILTADCDILAPCALGGVLNQQTIPQLKCRVVAGGANNQLLSDDDGEELHRLGILYAPDYIVNAGGIINVEAEMGDAGYSPERAREKTERIHEIMGSVIRTAQTEEISTATAAARIAEERLESVRRIRSMRRSCQ